MTYMQSYFMAGCLLALVPATEDYGTIINLVNETTMLE
jgi:hypothetical protein